MAKPNDPRASDACRPAGRRNTKYSWNKNTMKNFTLYVPSLQAGQDFGVNAVTILDPITGKRVVIPLAAALCPSLPGAPPDPAVHPQVPTIAAACPMPRFTPYTAGSR